MKKNLINMSSLTLPGFDFSTRLRDIIRGCQCSPVGCIIFRSAGNVLWIVCKFILLDFRLQVFGFGSPRTRARTMTTFTIQLLFLWFVARRSTRIWVFSNLQKALVSLLVLPVCEDLRVQSNRQKKNTFNNMYFQFGNQVER